MLPFQNKKIKKKKNVLSAETREIGFTADWLVHSARNRSTFKDLKKCILHIAKNDKIAEPTGSWIT